jgi:hypothetical protein
MPQENAGEVAMAHELQKEEAKIDQSIASELVSLTPEWWNVIVLEIERVELEQSTTLNIAVKSPEGHHDTIEPSRELYDFAMDLYDLFKRHGYLWKKVAYTVRLQPDGDWRFEAEFSY